MIKNCLDDKFKIGHRNPESFRKAGVNLPRHPKEKIIQLFHSKQKRLFKTNTKKNYFNTTIWAGKEKGIKIYSLH